RKRRKSKGTISTFLLIAYPELRFITQANVDDRQPLKDGNILKNVFGSLYADKGYISKELAEMLFDDGLHLVTGIRSNMKNVLMTLRDKILLRKRSVIETINDQLKNICDAEHSRHRSFGNFITNLVSSLIAYSFQEKKPSLKFEREENQNGQLALFCYWLIPNSGFDAKTDINIIFTNYIKVHEKCKN